MGQTRPTTEIAQGEKLRRTGASDFVRAIVDDDATPGQPSLRWWCCASAAVLLLQACGACWLLLGQRAPRSSAASGQRASKAVRPLLSKSRGLVALLLLLSALHWLHMQSSALSASLPVASPWAAAPFLSVGGGVCGGAGASPLVLQAR